MKMKEFSQKHGVLFFWLTIVLFIISISLSVYSCRGKNNLRNFSGGERGGMMQNGGRLMDSNNPRSFNKNSNLNNRNMINLQEEDQDVSEIPVVNEPIIN